MKNQMVSALKNQLVLALIVAGAITIAVPIFCLRRDRHFLGFLSVVGSVQSRSCRGKIRRLAATANPFKWALPIATPVRMTDVRFGSKADIRTAIVMSALPQ